MNRTQDDPNPSVWTRRGRAVLQVWRQGPVRWRIGPFAGAARVCAGIVYFRGQTGPGRELACGWRAGTGMGYDGMMRHRGSHCVNNG